MTINIHRQNRKVMCAITKTTEQLLEVTATITKPNCEAM